jgi:predicted aconitase
VLTIRPARRGEGKGAAVRLTQEEQEILDGGRGETLAKVMRTLVEYGDTFGAERMVPVTAPGHLVTSFGISILDAVFNVMDELIDAGLHTKEPFTVDPRPLDKNVPANPFQRLVGGITYSKQAAYEEQLRKVGLKDSNAFTCACYLPQVGNAPKRGDILSWAESSAVVYANSVIGARCNRNSGFIDLFGNILGEVPEFGLLTDEGRKATWVIDVRCEARPEAQVLGSAIGMRVMEEVPYIRGLAGHLGGRLDDAAKAYLKDMGAASASNGAVGLYHVEGITPEAVDLGEFLVAEGARTYVIDDAELERVKASYPNIWRKPNGRPQLAFIGCPHCSLEQLVSWAHRIHDALAAAGTSRVRIPTVVCSAPDVLAAFKATPEHDLLLSTGARLTYICPLMYMDNPATKTAVVTCSNKLRTYTDARYFDEDELLGIIARGTI